MFFKNRGKIS